ncbi:MAG: ribose-phosphate pyrophosphokinase [Bacteroidota bacterium]|nr:ribose-phosphate pyrophosphokinase [Bacteroidota bacterium]
MSNEVCIVAGRETRYLAEKIAKSYGQQLGNVKIQEFSDGEFQPSYEENIRGNDIFIIQSTFPPADNLLELLMMIDAAKRASARNIVAVMPYFGFARQDRKDKPRVSIASKLIANLLTSAGVNRIITLDLHADQIQGFFDIPVDHVFASTIFAPFLKQLDLPKITMASPDTGGTKRAASYAKALNTDFIICYKQRAKPNEVAEMHLVGDVKGKDIVLVDDIIDTGGTITKAAHLMMDNGANSVRAIATHPILSGEAIKRIEESPFEKVYVTDTIPQAHKCDKIEVLSTADLFAEVIKRVINNKSISSIFKI